MSKSVAKEAVLNTLETRYDFQSARNVLAKVLKETGISDKKTYSDEEINSLADGIEEFATHSAELLEALRELAGGSNGKASSSKASSSKSSSSKKDDDKKDAKAADKKDDKADDKKDDKADAKSSSSKSSSSKSSSSKSSSSKSSGKSSSKKK